jgi:hypothetical protein
MVRKLNETFSIGGRAYFIDTQFGERLQFHILRDLPRTDHDADCARAVWCRHPIRGGMIGCPEGAKALWSSPWAKPWCGSRLHKPGRWGFQRGERHLPFGRGVQGAMTCRPGRWGPGESELSPVRSRVQSPGRDPTARRWPWGSWGSMEAPPSGGAAAGRCE